jgi:thermostable 8-oxoguanine DNA glycosylase
MLSELTDYFVKWCETNAPTLQDLEALQYWATSTTKDQFLGNIKGLAARAHEQLLWYLEGKEAIELDRHVSNFVNQHVGRAVPEEEAVQALRQVANDLGISATALDARIWDYMQARASKGKPGSVTSRAAGSCRNRFHKRVRH